MRERASDLPRAAYRFARGAPSMTPHVHGRARELARAATLLEAAERLAGRAASGQAAIAHEAGAVRFLVAQARQEAFHARVFATAAAALAPGPRVAHPGGQALAAYAARLDRDLEADDLWAAVVGIQVILEALGRAVLEELEGRLVGYLPALAPLHRVLARQEAAHHAFGVRRVREAVASAELSAPRRRAAADDYRALAGGLLAAGAETLAALGDSPAPYTARFEALLPTWISGAA
jgi:hypothetical protein